MFANAMPASARVIRTLLIAALASAPCPAYAGETVAPVLQRPALLTNLAAHAVLLGIARAGDRLVAVGERGIIVISDDRGETWQQAAVPVSVTLTAVAFATPLQGWAVGHSGVIIHSRDGGRTWTPQLDGTRAARLSLLDARARLRTKPGAKRERDNVQQAEQLVADGPDKPFLGLHFWNARRGVVVGAYGLIFGTMDGGSSWQPWMGRLDNPDRNHIYAISVNGERISLAGEQGFIARSTDGGKRFVRLRSPYRGTYFAIANVASGKLFVAGLRGNVFRSDNAGATFNRVRSVLPDSFSALTTRRDGSLVVADQAGDLLVWHDPQATLHPLAPAVTGLRPIAGLIEAPDGALVVVGIGGATRIGFKRTAR